MCEAEHSTQASSEVKNLWRYASTLPILLHGAERDNFTFTFTIPFGCYSDELTELIHLILWQRTVNS